MNRYHDRNRLMLALLSGILVFGGCSNEPSGATQPTLAPADILMGIESSPRGIVMVVGDSQQLHVQARNILGDTIPLDDSFPVTYTSATISRVTVSPTGLIRAVRVTQSPTAAPAPVRIIARWQKGTITKADSIYVVVTLPPSQPIVSMSIQPSPYPIDSTWAGYGGGKTFEIKGKTASGDSVRNLYAFLYSDRRRQFLRETVEPATRSVFGGFPGKFWIYATASIYGETFQDSVQFTQIDPIYNFINPYVFTTNTAGAVTTLFANGGIWYFSPCATIMFQNGTTIPLTITFDDPAKTGVCVTGDVTGNIALTATGTAGATAIRKFPVAGLYRWTVTRTDGVTLTSPLYGTILIRDRTFWEPLP